LQGKRESISPEQKAQVQGKQLDRSQVGKQSSTNRLNEIFRPGREAANAAKVIIRGVKTLVALSGGRRKRWPVPFQSFFEL